MPNGADQTVYLVLDDFGRLGCAYRETDPERADLETTITDLISGQYHDPVRVVAFNTRRSSRRTETAAYLKARPGDTLTAGSGSDTFIFAANFGKNTVNAFDTHLDTIELSKAAFSNAAAVLANAHQVGTDTIITNNAADTITLTHVLLHDLHASNFLLA